jgi:aspartyl-tRNA(Asn)/glutamyl-tRNA(Gln) amidotransferase subunit A
MTAVSNLPDAYPQLFPHFDQTIAGAGRALRERQISCVKILEQCFAQVDEWEPKVHAWVILDRDNARDRARKLDHELKAGNDRGPLHGIPIGIKDIIDVAGMPTACGTKRLSNCVANRDANVVAKLIDAGALVMGKTVTTAHAWIDPPITRNPWNVERTPGGSSSGSAAAVACGMCLGAIGSQTGGSITRPASFCGVAGMKPDKSFLNDGTKPFAPSFDQVGPIARTVDDLKLMLQAMQGARSDPAPAPLADAGIGRPPRFARFRGFFDERAASAVKPSLDEAARILASAGATVVELDDPFDFGQVLKDHRLVMATEAARVHGNLLEEHPEDYPPRITELILEGRAVDATEYARLQRRIQDTGVQYVDAETDWKFEAVITPATVTTAPDPSTTGDPAFNSPWSYLRLPTVSFPIGLASDGLPLAIQLVANHYRDFELLQIAQWCERVIRSPHD